MRARISASVKGSAHRYCLGAGSLLFCLAALAVPASSAGIPEDLALDRNSFAHIRDSPNPNPHDDFPCLFCHVPVSADLTYEDAVRYKVRMPLATGGKTAASLCDGCHGDGYHFFHPVNFDVYPGNAGDPDVFPLEKTEESSRMITCVTCHDLHFPTTRNYLLRGFPLIPGKADEHFLTRLDFCRGCHGDLLELSCHETTSGEGNCRFCHTAGVNSGRKGTLKRHINEACTICHPNVRGETPHFLHFNPFPDFSRDELGDYGLALGDGRFTCGTCHSHHQEVEDAALLEPGYVTVASRSRRINPHRTDRFCENCHPYRPPPPGTPEGAAPLVVDGVTRLCLECHSGEQSLRMSHPLSVPSSEGMVPPEWNRRADGALGCQTCHLAGHGPFDPENPKMLRIDCRGERNRICFLCHDRSKYQDRNIHVEMAVSTGCDFCHVVSEKTALRPEGKVGALLAEPTWLCLLCHCPPPHPAGADHTGKVRNSNITVLDGNSALLSMGKVTCHSCHDSHSTRPETKFLRRVEGYKSICVSCHLL